MVKLFHAGVQIVIDQNIIILIHVDSLLPRTGKTLFNDLSSLRSATAQTGLKLLRTRRRDKDQQSIRELLLHLQSTLNLDLEKNVLSSFPLFHHILLRGSIIVSHILRMLNQGIFLNHLLKFFFFQEEIFPSILLSLTRSARGCRDRQRITVCVLCKQCLHQRSLASSGKSGNNRQQSLLTHLSRLLLTQYSESALSPSRSRS